MRIAEDERFVICFKPEAAERDAVVGARMIAQLEEVIRDPDQFSAGGRAELCGVIATRPGLNGTPAGAVRYRPQPVPLGGPPAGRGRRLR